MKRLLILSLILLAGCAHPVTICQRLPEQRALICGIADPAPGGVYLFR